MLTSMIFQDGEVLRNRSLMPKVSKVPNTTVHLDDSAVNLVLIQTTPSVQPENSTPPVAKAFQRTHPSV